MTKSWERREKSELDMGLCVAPLWFLLLICLSQAELGGVWAAEQEGKSSSGHKQVFQMRSVIYICNFLTNRLSSVLSDLNTCHQLLTGSACVNVPVSH